MAYVYSQLYIKKGIHPLKFLLPCLMINCYIKWIYGDSHIWLCIFISRHLFLIISYNIELTLSILVQGSRSIFNYSLNYARNVKIICMKSIKYTIPTNFLKEIFEIYLKVLLPTKYIILKAKMSNSKPVNFQLTWRKGIMD